MEVADEAIGADPERAGRHELAHLAELVVPESERRRVRFLVDRDQARAAAAAGVRQLDGAACGVEREVPEPQADAELRVASIATSDTG